MSVLRTVQVGAATAQAAVDAVEEYGADTDTLILRLGVLQLLKVQQEDLTADGEDAPLLDAYREWLAVALDYYGPDPDATVRDYARASAVLSAELQLAGMRGSPPSADGASAAAADGDVPAGGPPRG